VNDPLTLLTFNLSDKQERAIFLFWSGFLSYSLGYSLTVKADFNFAILQLFQTFGIGLMILGCVVLLRFRLESVYLDALFKIYCIWLSVVILRGISTDYELMKRLMFDAWYGMFVFLTPLALLFPRNLRFYRSAFTVVVISGSICLILYLGFIKQLLLPDFRNIASQGVVETISKTFGIPSGFILLTYMYHSRSRKIVAWLILAVTLYFAIIRARRGLIFMSLIPLVATYVLFLYNTKVKGLLIIFSVVIGLIVINYAITIYQQSDLFLNLKLRGFEDTRSGVETMFYRDMNGLDWLIGKGMAGQYYCPGIDSGDLSGYRFVIETDFLNIILKGGIISLVLFFLIAIPAVIKGFFFSNNNLSKASAAWILIGIINMYPSAVYTFTLNFVLVWVCIGICHSPLIRQLSEEVLVQYFRPARLSRVRGSYSVSQLPQLPEHNATIVH
jgi:hypothetical protein